MNRGVKGTPAGSSCGDLYIRAQDMCGLDVRGNRNNGTVYSVGVFEGLSVTHLYET